MFYARRWEVKGEQRYMFHHASIVLQSAVGEKAADPGWTVS